MGYSTFLSNFWSKCMVSRVQGTWSRGRGTECMVSRVRCTWFREYRVHSFEGMGYIVAHYPSVSNKLVLVVCRPPLVTEYWGYLASQITAGNMRSL